MTPALRPYRVTDEDAVIALWRRSWQKAYPHIDFDARSSWWRSRWRNEIVSKARIVVAEAGDELIGFVTVEPDTGYLDQVVVAPECWGTGAASSLLAEAKRLSPALLVLDVNCDNTRAIAFYRREGFMISGDGINPNSGAAVFKMKWDAQTPSNCSLASRE